MRAVKVVRIIRGVKILMFEKAWFITLAPDKIAKEQPTSTDLLITSNALILRFTPPCDLHWLHKKQIRFHWRPIRAGQIIQCHTGERV